MLLMSAAPYEYDLIKDKLADVPHTYLSVGVGSIEAAKSIVRFEKDLAGQEVIFFGSAGIIAEESSSTQNGNPKVFMARSATWKTLSEDQGDSYLVASGSKSYRWTNSPDIIIEERDVVCYSDVSQRARKNDHGSLENIELFSLFPEISQQSKRFLVLLVTTNFVGPGAHEAYKSQYEQAGKMLGDVINSVWKLRKGDSS